MRCGEVDRPPFNRTLSISHNPSYPTSEPVIFQNGGYRTFEVRDTG
jgi:hypothetical protein